MSEVDMPVVNIGNAKNLFANDALKLALTKGLNFKNCVSFMSDTTNVMKGHCTNQSVFIIETTVRYIPQVVSWTWTCSRT